MVASVGSRNIRKELFEHWVAVASSVDGGTDSGSGSSRGAIRRTVLGLLISWEWTLGEAQETGVSVSEPDVVRQLALSEADLRDGVPYEWFAGERKLKKYLTSNKVTTQDRLWLVRLGMLAAKLFERRVTTARYEVRRARIADYYRLNKHSFVVSERRDVEAIINRSRSRVVEAKRELEAGVKFRDVAERFNQTIEGGLRLGRARGAGMKRYERDYFAAPPHVLVGPRKEILYYVFRVLSIKPRHRKTLAEVEPVIRQRLAAQDAARVLATTYERVWRPRTHCRAEYAVPECGNA